MFDRGSARGARGAGRPPHRSTTRPRPPWKKATPDPPARGSCAGENCVRGHDPPAARTALHTFPARFDRAIADKALKGMSGLDFARAVRASGARPPVILSAAVGDELEAEDLTSAGVADVVRRPWRSGSLAATLTRNLSAG